jgi:hypothetical protein
MTNLSLVRPTVNIAIATSLATLGGFQAPTSAAASGTGSRYLGLSVLCFVVAVYLLMRVGVAFGSLVDGIARAITRLAGIAFTLAVVAVILIVALALIVAATAP